MADRELIDTGRKDNPKNGADSSPNRIGIKNGMELPSPNIANMINESEVQLEWYREVEETEFIT